MCRKTRDVIYWVSIIGPLIDCAVGFVKGIVSVVKSGELIDEYKRARDERVQASLDKYIKEVKQKMDADFEKNQANVTISDMEQFLNEVNNGRITK